jgi:hypothetical protein
MVEAPGWLEKLRDDQRRIVPSKISMAPGATAPILPLVTLALGMGTDR